ncbi:hypothetical protein T265_00346 [Opisthorchis viverrini]|uniref:Uncharacterized protein n=1 Tax=Opisthorchis viverrini TaxID=6198 RepID=A0A075A3F5_OPIVI|nr:hypothetical protein T265_00346 [Opisthorchis viverrini]KER33906.1 hypothetical protein T265_00346 [Opisthorchis viverrini]
MVSDRRWCGMRRSRTLRATGCDVDCLVHQPMIISHLWICFLQSAKAVIGLDPPKTTVSDLFGLSAYLKHLCVVSSVEYTILLSDTLCLMCEFRLGRHWTRVSLLLERISSVYPMAVPGFEPRTPDMRGERVTTNPQTHVGCI